jgi:hypothetical protein
MFSDQHPADTHRTATNRDREEAIHIYPQFGPAHILEAGQTCWCQPTVTFDATAPCTPIVVHSVAH